LKPDGVVVLATSPSPIVQKRDVGQVESTHHHRPPGSSPRGTTHGGLHQSLKRG
jgi:hypothetical protein